MTDRTCAELFDHTHATIIGDADRPILGVAYCSDQVGPGDAFCCIVGLKADGHAFAQDAVDRGATVLVVERMLEVKGDNDVTFILVNDTRKAMAHLAAHFYRMPTQDLSLVGITGTNGKTTTAHLVEHIASTLGKTTGVIGTVGIDIAGKALPANHTTPESCDLQHIFAEMRDAGCEVVAMEVSSHALDLDRVWDSTFAVTAFTNLTQDHLDYHKTFEAYFAAKRRLFSADYPAKRVINIDSTWGERLVADALEQGDEVITTGFAENADIHPIEIAYDVARTRIVLGVRGEAIAFEYPLVGKFNVENVMTAFGIALELGFAPHDIARALSDVPPVPGRIEHVMLGAGEGSDRAREIAVYVDYAHTPMRSKKRSRRSNSLRKARPSSCSAAEGIATRPNVRSWVKQRSRQTSQWSLLIIPVPNRPMRSSRISLPACRNAVSASASSPIANARLSMRSRLRTLEILYSSPARATKTIRSSVRAKHPFDDRAGSRVKRSRSSISSDEAQF